MPHGSAAEQHARWRAYFNATSAALGGAEVCDCHRRGCCGWDLLTENRATRLDGGGVLSFATQLGSSGWPLHGSIRLEAPLAALRLPLPCAPGECVGPPQWKAPWPAFLERLAASGHVTDLVLNAGHHWSLAAAPDGYAERLFRAAAAATRHGRQAAGSADGAQGDSGAGEGHGNGMHNQGGEDAGREGVDNERGGGGAWWRTTTATMRHALTPARSRRRADGLALDGRPLRQLATETAALKAGLGVFDALAVTERLGELAPRDARRGAWVEWDEAHFTCSVYRELNILLLNLLCDPTALGE